MDWIALGESSAFIALYTGVKFAFIVAVATIVLSVAAIFLIESLEGFARNVKAWLRKPGKLNGMWA